MGMHVCAMHLATFACWAFLVGSIFIFSLLLVAYKYLFASCSFGLGYSAAGGPALIGMDELGAFIAAAE